MANLYQVYQVVRKLVDEQAQYDGTAVKLTLSTVYDRIKRSNSSLNRKSKKLLENSIERVIAVVKEEEIDDDATSIEGNYDGMEDTPPIVKVGNCTQPGVLDISG